MISRDRMAHQLAVAERVVDLASNRGNPSEEDLQELFVMGYLHDIGYKFAKDLDQHARVGGEALRRMGFKCWREVANHGDPRSGYASTELDLLNAADMSTSPQGEAVSFDDRLADIGARYGVDSGRYLNASQLIRQLRAKGLNL